jgi:hypothetical protein
MLKDNFVFMVFVVFISILQTAKASEPEHLSLMTVISNPDRYHGRYMLVKGYIDVGFEHQDNLSDCCHIDNQPHISHDVYLGDITSRRSNYHQATSPRACPFVYITTMRSNFHIRIKEQKPFSPEHALRCHISKHNFLHL